MIHALCSLNWNFFLFLDKVVLELGLAMGSVKVFRWISGYPVAVADQGFNGSPESCGSWHPGCNRVPHQQDRQTIFFLDSKSSESFGQVSQPGFGLYIHLYETIDMCWTFMMHADNTFSSPVTTTLRQMSATPWGPWTHLLCYMIGILFLLSRQDLRLLNKSLFRHVQLTILRQWKKTNGMWAISAENWKVPTFLRCQDIFATSTKLSKFTGGERCYRPEPLISSPGGWAADRLWKCFCHWIPLIPKEKSKSSTVISPLKILHLPRP